MTALTLALLLCTVTVRWLAGSKRVTAWYLDLATVPAWTAFYVLAEAWFLLPIPYIFGAIDVRNILAWRRPT